MAIKDFIKKFIVKIKLLGIALLVVLLSSAAGLLLLLSVYSLPIENIMTNVSESADIIEEEGTYPLFWEDRLIRLSPENMRDPKALLFNNRMTARDNYTDSYMLLNAAYSGEEPLLERALKVYRYNNFQNEPHLTLTYVYKEDRWDNLTVEEYARYWHGYLVFLKPLLELLNYGQIRVLNVILMLLLLVGDVYLIGKRLQVQGGGDMVGAMPLKINARNKKNAGIRRKVFALTYGFLFFMPFTVPFCMQFCTCSYVILIAIGLIAAKGEKWSERENALTILFLVLGIITSYVDYLTFPLTTFGLPLLLLWTLYPERTRKFVKLVEYGFFWCIGYVGMWSMKWVYVNLLLGDNLIGEAIQQVAFRSSSAMDNEEGTISILGALGSNFCNYINIAYLLLILVAMVWIILVIKAYLVDKSGELTQPSLFLYFLVALLPLGWYVVFRNHSYSHGSFTYRDLSVLVMSGLLFFAELGNPVADMKKS